MTLMKRWIFLISGLVLVGLPVQAGLWPRTESALTQWQGERELLLRSSLPDPLSDPEVQRLVEYLLDRGFLVTPGPSDARVDNGLILDLKAGESGRILILSRAPEGSILALDRLGKVSPEETQVTPLQQAPFPKESKPHTAGKGMKKRVLNIPGNPRHLAVGEKSGRPELVLLSDSALERYRISDKGLLPLGSYPAPISSSKALRVDAADIDGDGKDEYSVVWAEEVGQIYGGTDARIHSWLLFANGNFQPASEDLKGYLRLLGAAEGFWQGRGAERPFAGPVCRLITSAEGAGLQEVPVSWGKRSLYEVTPLDAKEGIAWMSEGRLALVSLATGEPVPGGELLEDLGSFRGTTVAIRKQDPEFRSGFERADRVLETYFPLPRRTVLRGRDAVFTILRGRSEGFPLLGRPTGQDQVVRVVHRGSGLVLERPFPPVDYYILDFALAGDKAVLLLNDKVDGSGNARVLVQKAGEGM